MEQSQKPVVFTDIDGTFFRSSLFIELIERLIEHDIFPLESRAEFEADYHAWLDREGTYEAYIGSMIHTFLKHIKGVHYGEVADIGREMVADHQKRVYRYTRDKIKELKEAGYYVVAISQSPKMILDEFCAPYGFDKVYGRIYEIGPTDRFTGYVLDEEVIADKANIVQRVFEKEFVTDEDSIAIGDTEGDITMFEQVEHPICFNPNQTLYDQAQKMRWKVVVERKDVIYEL